jgi:DUF917 family protein
MSVIGNFRSQFRRETLRIIFDDPANKRFVAAMGSMAFSAIYPMSGRQVRECAVLGSLTLLLGIGRAIRVGRDRADGNPFASLLAYLSRSVFKKPNRDFGLRERET